MSILTLVHIFGLLYLGPMRTRVGIWFFRGHIMENLDPESSFYELGALFTFRAPPEQVAARLLLPHGRNAFITYTYRTAYEVSDRIILNSVDSFVLDGEIVPQSKLQQSGPAQTFNVGFQGSPDVGAYIRTLMNRPPFDAEFVSVSKPRRFPFSFDIRDWRRNKKEYWYQYHIFFWTRKSESNKRNVVRLSEYRK